MGIMYITRINCVSTVVKSLLGAVLNMLAQLIVVTNYDLLDLQQMMTIVGPKKINNNIV